MESARGKYNVVEPTDSAAGAEAWLHEFIWQGSKPCVVKVKGRLNDLNTLAAGSLFQFGTDNTR